MMTRFVEWLYQWAGDYLGKRHVGLPTVSVDVMDEADTIVTQWREHDHLSGEYKRYKCYKRLVEKFPLENRCALSVAIEIAYHRYA